MLIFVGVAAVTIITVTLYACCVVAGDADRKTEEYYKNKLKQ